MSTGKQIITGFLLLMTLVLAGVAFFVAYTLQQDTAGEDAAATAGLNSITPVNDFSIQEFSSSFSCRDLFTEAFISEFESEILNFFPYPNNQRSVLNCELELENGVSIISYANLASSDSTSGFAQILTDSRYDQIFREDYDRGTAVYTFDQFTKECAGFFEYSSNDLEFFTIEVVGADGCENYYETITDIFNNLYLSLENYLFQTD